jgi:hypothetical protein
MTEREGEGASFLRPVKYVIGFFKNNIFINISFQYLV